jgi:hypothetical protein
MIRRPAFVILLVALVGAGTAACGSGSTGSTQPVAATSSPATSATASAPAVKVSTRTVTVTVASSAAATATTSVGTTTRASTPAPTASAVSFTPFVGEWVGHTRDVTVSASGRLEEHVGDGCCDPIIDLVQQLSNPRRAGGAWVATTRVVSATPHPGWKQTGQAAPKPGDHGTLTIGADHVLVDSITGNGFCDQGKTAPGTCGA